MSKKRKKPSPSMKGALVTPSAADWWAGKKVPDSPGPPPVIKPLPTDSPPSSPPEPDKPTPEPLMLCSKLLGLLPESSEPLRPLQFDFSERLSSSSGSAASPSSTERASGKTPS